MGAPAAAATTTSASSTALAGSADQSDLRSLSAPSISAAATRRLRTASSFWNATATCTLAATARVSSISSPAQVNSSAATASRSSSASGFDPSSDTPFEGSSGAAMSARGGRFAAAVSAAFASRTHAAARLTLALVAAASFWFWAFSDDFCFLHPAWRSTSRHILSSRATDLR